MAKELTGNWREDHLFNLAQGLKMYDSLTERIGDYQREIERRIGKQSRPEAESTGSPGRPSSVLAHIRPIRAYFSVLHSVASFSKWERMRTSRRKSRRRDLS